MNHEAPFDFRITNTIVCFVCLRKASETYDVLKGCIPIRPTLPRGWKLLNGIKSVCPNHTIEIKIDGVDHGTE